MKTTRARISGGGRLVIPAEYRHALGMDVGDPVIVGLEDGEIRIFTVQEAIKRAQELMRPYIKKGRSLSDELIAERRAEAARE
jgi:AbrB family looped-hinge helix DNA binding protein